MSRWDGFSDRQRSPGAGDAGAAPVSEGPKSGSVKHAPWFIPSATGPERMSQLAPLETAVDRFLDGFLAAVPDVLSGLAFLAVAAVGIKIITWLVRRLLDRILAEEDVVYRQFVVTIVAGLLWFGAVLSFLSIVGLTLVAASMGTATGFVALGVAYALSGMIEDAVAGIYLLRDPDFNVGDTVTAADVTGEVKAIELRKTRFSVDESTVVKSNGAIEKSWEKHAG